MHLITGHNVQEHQILLAVINLPYKEEKKVVGEELKWTSWWIETWGNRNKLTNANIWTFSRASNITVIIFPQ